MAVSSNGNASRLLPLRLPRVCVAVTGTDAAEMVEKAESIVRDNPFIEFRLDYLAKPALGIPKIKQFLEYHSYVTAIATCRRASSGGKFKGSLAAQLEILSKASAAGCQVLDLEVQSASAAKPDQVQKLRVHSAL